MKHQALRLFLWRWHRRLGLSAAVLLIWLSVSGVLLNHTSYFNLASIKLPVSLANTVYPVTYTKARLLETSLGMIEQRDQLLYLQGRSIQSCDGQFVGAVMIAQELWLACTNQILILGEKGQLLESLDKFSGLEIPINKIGSCNNSVCLESNQQVFMVDAATVSWLPHQAGASWVSAITSDKQFPQLLPEVHNLQRLILEAHSGRIFGVSGVLLMDLAALAIVLLALSGCFVWWSHYRRRKLALRQR
ncbi:MAG: putative iron-regulated membrane protein [Arenicella sp.]|jgi:uncharacterized iron-regulated membrane protein